MLIKTKKIKLLSRYLKNKSGNVAMMFSVTMMLILLGVGVAADFSIMSKKNTSYQGFADAAVLAAAQSGLTDLAELQALAEAYVFANSMGNEELVTELTIKPNGRIRVEVSARHEMVMMGLFGKKQADVATSAEAPFSSTGPVEIALVLDITGSMSGTRIDSLKTAANGLVNKIEALDNENFRVAVVPFRDYVNIGTARSTEPWLELDFASGDESSDNTGQGNNGNHGQGNNGNGNGNQGQGNNGNHGQGNNGNGGDSDSSTSGSANVWNGCAGSREAPWTTRPDAGPAPIPGAMNINCGQEILPLTNDMASVRDKINSLTAQSWTYIPTGLMWGWRAVDPRAPLTEASTVPTLNKTSVIILMTDGANTRSQQGNLHNGSDKNNANALTSSMCAEVKSARIQLYTVAYELDNQTTLAILKQCATKADMYFDASNAAALKAAFDNIAENLVTIRLSH